MKTLVLITNIPTPYRVPFFNRLSALLLKNGIKLEVIFAAMSYPRRQWQMSVSDFHFSYRVLENSKQISINSGESVAFSYSGLNSVLESLSPEWVVSSGFGLCTVKALAHGLIRRTPVFIWSGEIHNRHRNISALRRLYRRLLLKRASGGIAYGAAAVNYLTSMGMPAENIQIARNTVDVDFFTSLSRAEQSHFPRLIIVGNLEKFKRVDLALQVLSELNQRGNIHVCLDVIGAGSEEDNLKMQAVDLGIAEQAVFHGFQQKESLAEFYRHGALMLFPSEYDIWGLVMAESLAAGVPVISSPEPGAASELIRPGQTGEIVNYDDVKVVAAKIEELLLDTQRLKQMSQQCRSFAEENLSLQSMAEGFSTHFIPNESR